MPLFKNKKKNVMDSENTIAHRKSPKHTIGLNTQQIGEVSAFDWVSRIKVIPLGILTAAALIGAVFTYVNYSSELDKNRQKTSYLSDLRQLSERIEKSAILVRGADARAFEDLDQSRSTIEKLLAVLQKGGTINPSDKEIDPMSSQFVTQFEKINSEWSGNKALINTLVSQKKNLVDLKTEVDKVKVVTQTVIDNSIAIQKSLENQDKSQAAVAQEFIILTNRINQGLGNLFSGESFALESGYALVKDLRQLNYFITSLQRGNEVLNLNPISGAAIANLQTLQASSQPLFNITERIAAQIDNLNSAKEVARAVTNSAREISLAAQDLNSEFVKEVSTLNKYRLVAIALFLVALIGALLLALVFYERSLQALRLAKVLQRNQANENAVNLLLNQLTPLDEGDFSQRVHVEDKFILPISERVDNTRKTFGKIVKQMKITADEVLDSSNETENTSQKLLQVSGEQYEKMGHSIGRIGKLTSEMDELSQVTWLAQEDSKESRQASIEGEALVRQSIDKMDEIRNTIQESSKKIKKLGESAQSITEVTSLIQDITKQINVLALNAAIQAASSGESGREFTIVAQEVQRLAFDSESATRKIADIIAEIQTDTASAVSSMEKTTQEVVIGAQLTDQAGNALKKIEQLSNKVAVGVQEASTKLEEKSAEMATFAIEMKTLQDITEESVNVIRLSAQQVESLKSISQKLDDSVSKYKVE